MNAEHNLKGLKLVCADAKLKAQSKYAAMIEELFLISLIRIDPAELTGNEY
jgi:hypothetical protein